MEKDFNKIIERARRVSLSYDERDAIRHRLKAAIGFNEPLVIGRFRFLSFRFAAAALGILVMVGASVSWAAENSLPGNPLYVVKNFNEKIHGLLTLTPEKSAEWQVMLADRRLEETEKLNNLGSLDENKRAVLEFKFDTNANKFNKEIKTLKSEHKLRKADELSAKLESVIEKRKKILTEMTYRGEVINPNSEVNVILNKVNLRSEQLMAERQELEDAIAKDENDIYYGNPNGPDSLEIKGEADREMFKVEGELKIEENRGEANGLKLKIGN